MNKPTKDKPKKGQLNPFVKYSSMGMQMVLPIIGGVYGGLKLDEVYETGNLWTVVLSLIGVFAGLYLALKDFIKQAND